MMIMTIVLRTHKKRENVKVFFIFKENVCSNKLYKLIYANKLLISAKNLELLILLNIFLFMMSTYQDEGPVYLFTIGEFT